MTSINGADIQVENGGFARIHHAILDALGNAPLNGSEFRCLMYLFKQTYGWQRKEYKISMGQWAKAVNLDRRVVIRATQHLLACGVIYRIDNGDRRPATWGFNKYVEQWDFDATSDNHVTIQEASTSDNPDTSLASTSDNPDTKTSDKFVTPIKKNKEPAVRREPSAAAQPLPPARDSFIAAYERIWGMLVESEYRAQEIDDWRERVTLEAWEYGLKECADRNKRGNMKYLSSILRRVEQEGLTPKPTQSTSQVNFTLEQII